MKKVTPLLLLTISVLITFSSCYKEDDKEDEIIVETGNFSDPRDGQTYKWVKIGEQVWMAENLKYLPGVFGPASVSHTVPYFYVYDYHGNDAAKAKATAEYQTYGALYNWTASLTACPPGWHLPSPDEWLLLIEKVGKNPGSKLKSRNGWYGSGNSGLDNYGFTALPGGGRYSNFDENYFGGAMYTGLWWIVNEHDELPKHAWYMIMGNDSDGVTMGYVGYKGNGFSVRCLKD